MNRSRYANATEKEIEREFERNTGIPISFRWEDIGGGKKRGVLTPTKKNTSDLKTVGNGQLVNFQIENPEGKLFEASDDWKDWDTEWEKIKALWRKQEAKAGISSSERHYWRSWNNDGSIGTEGMYIKSENQSQLINFENKTNSPQIKEIIDKETRQEKTDESSSNFNKKDQHLKENNQLDQSQKTDNKDSNDKNIHYGVGLTSLVLLLISVMVVWVKKKK